MKLTERTKKSLCLLLSLLMLLSFSAIFTACGETSADPTATTAPEEQSESIEPETEAEATEDRLNAKDSLPDDLDFGGATVTVLTRVGDEDTRLEFIAEKYGGNVVSDAVYERNTLVLERLDIQMEIVESADSRHAGDIINNQIAKTVNAGTDDFDLMGNHLAASSAPVIAGHLQDLTRYEYLDQEQPWWNQSYIESITISGKQYLTVGELSLTYISGLYAMFYNKFLWEQTHEANELYDLVKNGGWTMDALISYTADYNRDLNGDSSIDGQDMAGLSTNPAGIVADALAGACDIRCVERSEDGTYAFVMNNERTIRFVEKMKVLLFENHGTITDPKSDGLQKLSENTALFTIGMLSDTAILRDMEDDYGIIPIPKLDTSQPGYTGVAHNGLSVFGIPVTVTEKGDMVTAFLEAMCAESYRRVTYAYYDIALKTQHARDPITAQMLDTILAGVTFDFGYIFNRPLNMPYLCFRQLLASSAATGKASSTFKTLERSTNRAIEQVLQNIES